MRPTLSSLVACALLLTACGPKTLELPEDALGRASTCGAVTAAAERAASPDFKAPLSLDAIGRVIHYPLLAGSAGGEFSADTAAEVQKRMTEIQNSVVDSKWQELVPACKAAFPATAIKEVQLPANRLDAQLGCAELGDFLRNALEGEDSYINDMGEYRRLANRLEPALAAALPRSDSAARAKRREALAEISKVGQPAAVMRQCLQRFG